MANERQVHDLTAYAERIAKRAESTGFFHTVSRIRCDVGLFERVMRKVARKHGLSLRITDHAYKGAEWRNVMMGIEKRVVTLS